MATKKTALPSKKPPPPPKTRPGPARSPYGPQGKVPARAPGERYATMPPPSRPLPRVTAPAGRTAPAPASAPARPLRPVGPSALPPVEVPDTTVFSDMPQPEPLPELAPEPIPEQTPEPMYGPTLPTPSPFKRGGFVKKADGIAKRGKTKGRYI